VSEHQTGLFAGFLAAQAILTGCTHAYVETVADDPEPDWLDPPPSGPPASQYAVPSSNPKGTAYIVSLGPEELFDPAERLESFLHLRVSVENGTDPIPWTLDSRDMRVTFDGASSTLQRTPAPLRPDRPGHTGGKEGISTCTFPWEWPADLCMSISCGRFIAAVQPTPSVLVRVVERAYRGRRLLPAVL